MAYDASSSLYQTTGLQTLKGDPGPVGPQGVPGIPGNTVWNGSGAPASSLGLPGDLYIDTTNFLFYGPKTFSGWPTSGVTTRGPQGIQGTQGNQGVVGPTGPAPFQLPAVAWAASTTYSASVPASLVYYQNALYICTTTHVSQSTFGAANFQLVIGAPSYDSVTLTTSAKAPTPAAGDSSTNIATTAFVTGNFSATAPKVDGVAAVGTATTAARSDHVHPTDTSRQAALGFTPVQQGTGPNQNTTTVAIGGSAGNTPRVSLGGTDLGRLWCDSLSSLTPGTASFGSSGYTKLPNGLIFQWGSNSSGNDVGNTLPVAFPNTILGAVACMDNNNGSALGANMIAVVIDQLTNTNVTTRPRYVNNGGAVGVASQPVRFFCWGY